jgi:hypothetical protein
MSNIKKILSSDLLESISISFLVNVILFMVLSLITVVLENKRESLIVLESSPVEYEHYEEPVELIDITTFDQKVTVLKPESQAPLSVSNEISNTIPQLDIISDVSLEKVQDFSIVSETDVIQNINIGTSISQDTSVGGVLDRLTIEIANNAKNNDLNVIWLFDASISLSKQREDIRDRFEKIIQEIGMNSFSHSIKHTICSFGSSLSVINSDPTNDKDILYKSIDSIVLDETGVENIFGSIEQLCKQYKTTRNMIVVFTDEIGDDINLLDKTVVEARRKGTRIYVVGPPAPFGLSSIEFKYVDPDPKFDQNERWVEINQGPETLFKMTLDLYSLPIDESGLDSGFGPYALSKICVDTGGIYFAVHPNRNENQVSKKEISPLSSYISVFFDNAVMKKYSPDYRSILLQTKENQTHKIKTALLNACKIPIQINNSQKTNFTAYTEGEFVEQLNEAQKYSAKIEPQIDRIYSILKEVESQSKSLDEKRWLASYNLAMGRILATKCRIELYNAMLAEAKTGLQKNDPKNNLWNLEFDAEFTTKSSQLQKSYATAIKYLQSIVSDFPDTPWALVAQNELDTPMGYKWIDSYKEPPKMNDRSNNNNNPLPKDDIKRKIELKPQRKIDKI